MSAPYVCAFRGRRDDYQVPLALAEAGRLDRFITDAYASPGLLQLADRLPPRLQKVVRFRHKPGLPPERVRCLWGATLEEHLRHRLGFSRAATYAHIDGRYSEAAAARARAVRGDLLLYSPYAWEAFTGRYRHTPRRVLFQFHPHANTEERLLRADVARFPEIAHSFAQETGQGVPEKLRQREGSCWRHSDRILCASTFTQSTLLEAGADPAQCLVAPYGIEDVPDAAGGDGEETPPEEGFHALFVGSGVQRKGLHHLLRAWARAALPAGSSLTLVCRVLDPGLREPAARTPGVRLRPGVGQGELAALYRRCTLLAMPSLVEGFGQVYLEALAAGCPVLGTANTCLPDLGGEDDGVFLTEPGNVDALVHGLERLARILPGATERRARARQCARAFTWPRFRRAVVSCL